MRFVIIPTGIPNTNIQTAYAFLCIDGSCFWTNCRSLIGLIGHALTDALSYGSVWWSWVIVSAFIGLLIGFFKNRINIERGDFGKKEIISFNLIQAAVQAIGWVVVAPVLDILIYAEPANKVFVQGYPGLSRIIAVGANIFTVFTPSLVHCY